jgi:hypothetical protein
MKIRFDFCDGLTERDGRAFPSGIAHGAVAAAGFLTRRATANYSQYSLFLGDPNACRSNKNSFGHIQGLLRQSYFLAKRSTILFQR